MSSATDISRGGSGQPTAAGARKAFGLEIGVDVQPYDSGLAALAAFNTNGFIVQTANDTYAGRTITGTANEVTVTNGSGVSGNPVISLPSALTFTGKTVTGGTFDIGTLTVSGTTTGTGLATFLDGLVVRNGTVNTQSIIVNFAYDTDQIAWRIGLEANNSLSLFSYNVSTGAFIANPLNLTQAGALTIQGAIAGFSTLFISSTINTTGTYLVNSTQVVGARNTGWGTDTGTAKKTANTVYTAPTISNPPTQAEVQAMANALQNASQTIKALKDALATHGLIGA